jgi:hypothetical protein
LILLLPASGLRSGNAADTVSYARRVSPPRIVEDPWRGCTPHGLVQRLRGALCQRRHTGCVPLCDVPDSLLMFPILHRLPLAFSGFFILSQSGRALALGHDAFQLELAGVTEYQSYDEKAIARTTTSKTATEASVNAPVRSRGIIWRDLSQWRLSRRCIERAKQHPLTIRLAR